jgi:hypothetical protein
MQSIDSQASDAPGSEAATGPETQAAKVGIWLNSVRYLPMPPTTDGFCFSSTFI